LDILVVVVGALVFAAHDVDLVEVGGVAADAY